MNLIKSWNDKTIRIREDRYVSLTDMAQASDKNFGHWFANKSTNSYLETLSGVIGIPITELVQVKQGGTPDEQGTWGHPKVALRFAQWCSDEFAVQVDCWVDELLTTGQVSLQPKTKIQILAELTAQMAEAERIQMEHSQLLADHGSTIGVLESELAAFKNSDGHYMTVVGYANLLGVKVSRADSQRIGRLAGKLYREETGEKPKQKPDEGYGTINVYPQHILKRAFETR